MKLDLALAAVVLVFGLMGLASGAIRQLGHLAGVALGYLVARPAAVLLAPYVARRFGYSLLFTQLACTFALFFLVYLGGSALARLALGKVLPDGERGVANRLGGLLLGALKASIVLFVVLSIAVFLDKPLFALVKGLKREADASLAVAAARRYNVFKSLPQLQGLQKVAEASRNPEAAAKLAEDPDYKALAKDPRVKSLVSDRAIASALEDGDVGAMLSNMKFLEVLNDPRLADRLGRVSEH